MIRSAHRLLSLLSVVVCALLSVSATAQMSMTEMTRRVGITIAAGGNSGARQRKRSISEMPWEKISVDSRQRIHEVLDNCSQYRRLPEFRYNARPEVYRYLVKHPDVAVSTWRVLGISKVQMWQTGSLEFQATAPDGSVGLIDVLYRDQTQCLLLFDGIYSSPLLPRSITASGLVWLRYDCRPAKDGKTQVYQMLDVFVSFPSVTARAMALLVSPISNMMMDRNAFEVSLYVRMMSQAVENDPAWIEQLVGQLDGVLPQCREELISLVRSVETDRARTTAVSGRTTRSIRPQRIFRASVSDPDRTVLAPAFIRQSAGPDVRDDGEPEIHNPTKQLSNGPTGARSPAEQSPDQNSSEGEPPAAPVNPAADD